MSHENHFSLKVSDPLAKAIPLWLGKIEAQQLTEAGSAMLTEEGELYFNSKNIQVLLKHADGTVGEMEPFRLKKQALTILKHAHQTIAAFGTRRLSLESDIQDLQETEIGSHSRLS